MSLNIVTVEGPLPLSAVILTVQDGSELPSDGSEVLAFVAPAGGIRLHSTATLLDRRLFVFVGSGHTCTYYDEGSGSVVDVASGWVQFSVPV